MNKTRQVIDVENPFYGYTFSDVVNTSISAYEIDVDNRRCMFEKSQMNKINQKSESNYE